MILVLSVSGLIGFVLLRSFVAGQAHSNPENEITLSDVLAQAGKSFSKAQLQSDETIAQLKLILGDRGEEAMEKLAEHISTTQQKAEETVEKLAQAFETKDRDKNSRKLRIVATQTILELRSQAQLGMTSLTDIANSFSSSKEQLAKIDELVLQYQKMHDQEMAPLIDLINKIK